MPAPSFALYAAGDLPMRDIFKNEVGEVKRICITISREVSERTKPRNLERLASLRRVGLRWRGYPPAPPFFTTLMFRLLGAR